MDLEPGQFIAKFNINNFEINDVSSWLLEFRLKSKITFLTTSVRSPKSPETIFKVLKLIHLKLKNFSFFLQIIFGFRNVIDATIIQGLKKTPSQVRNIMIVRLH